MAWIWSSLNWSYSHLEIMLSRLVNHGVPSYYTQLQSLYLITFSIWIRLGHTSSSVLSASKCSISIDNLINLSKASAAISFFSWTSKETGSNCSGLSSETPAYYFFAITAWTWDLSASSNFLAMVVDLFKVNYLFISVIGVGDIGSSFPFSFKSKFFSKSSSS